ncbi:hypothetical protein [Streptomyces sp. BA2]|uniref:hypothetical protein n=1 Tax=Streptomyces sp. BA2 TaxID=436595 RepID=UPI0019236080|nr:hypothetical protein [Streptomyces sp. BA2]
MNALLLRIRESARESAREGARETGDINSLTDLSVHAAADAAAVAVGQDYGGPPGSGQVSCRDPQALPGGAPFTLTQQPLIASDHRTELAE